MPEPMHILAVDDDRTILRGISVLLRSNGFAVSTISEGQKAVEEAARIHPDLILLDLRMPDLDGYTVLCNLAARQETMGIPVIVLSANVKVLNAARLADLGAAFVIQKPFDDAELLAAIERALADRMAVAPMRS